MDEQLRFGPFLILLFPGRFENELEVQIRDWKQQILEHVERTRLMR
jgi:hypothetical protein